MDIYINFSAFVHIVKKPANPKCPSCNGQSVKNGNREIKKRYYQRYKCKSCNKSFTFQSAYQRNKTYPLRTIIKEISNYNLGKPLRKLSVPKSTIHNWLRNINLPMNRLRTKLINQPIHKTIIKHRFVHHKQPFLYQYHKLKLDFAKKFPTLISYLKTIPTELPKDIFQSSKRISAISKEGKETAQLTTKQNYAVELAKIASAITTNNKARHQIIENFMLINDTATIATEIPVYLKENNQNLTGHIDILQSRFHKLYILDYKPEPVNKSQTINQLKLYRKALSERTNIPNNKIHLAFFNENGYYEINLRVRPT